MRICRLVVKYRRWLIVALVTFFFMFAGYEVSILPEAVADKCDQPERANNNYCPGYIVAGAFL